METSALSPNPSPNLGEGRRGGGSPLAGKHIVVTRAREQADELSEKLRTLGALPIEWPMIQIAPPADFAPLDHAIKNVMQYDWIVFSSVNGVKYFWNRKVLCHAHDRARDALQSRVSHRIDDCQMRLPRIAAVGAQTAQALRQNGLRVDAMPSEFLAREIVDTLGDISHQKILLVRPEIAPPDLAQALRARGARVHEVVAYRTLPVQYTQPIALADVDAVALASASAAQNFVAQLRGQAAHETVCVACIGPSTAQAARDAGLRVDVVAQPHTLDGLVAALVKYFRREKQP